MPRRKRIPRVYCELVVGYEYRPKGWAYYQGRANPPMIRLTPSITARRRPFLTNGLVPVVIEPLLFQTLRPIDIPALCLDAMGFGVYC